MCVCVLMFFLTFAIFVCIYELFHRHWSLSKPSNRIQVLIIIIIMMMVDRSYRSIERSVIHLRNYKCSIECTLLQMDTASTPIKWNVLELVLQFISFFYYFCFFFFLIRKTVWIIAGPMHTAPCVHLVQCTINYSFDLYS